MATDLQTASQGRGSNRRKRHCLLVPVCFVAVLMFSAASVAAAEYVATALIRVNISMPSLLGEETSNPNGLRSFDILKRTQVALLKSHFVLNSALRKPGIAKLSIVESKPDPVAWLQNNLIIEFPEDAEILAISLQGNEPQAELAQMVDAVTKAYQDEVTFREKSRRLNLIDLLARSLERLNEEISRKSEELMDIARENGAIDGGVGGVVQQLEIRRLHRIDDEIMRLENEHLRLKISGNESNNKHLEERLGQLRERQAELEKQIVSRDQTSVDVSMRRRELNRLQEFADEMSLALARLDLQSKAPERIELIQSAFVRLAK